MSWFCTGRASVVDIFQEAAEGELVPWCQTIPFYERRMPADQKLAIQKGEG